MERPIKRLREESKESLLLSLRELRAQLYLLKFQNSTGQLDENHKLSRTKREIAMILTLLRGEQLGIEKLAPTTKKNLAKTSKASKETKLTTKQQKLNSASEADTKKTRVVKKANKDKTLGD